MNLEKKNYLLSHNFFSLFHSYISIPKNSLKEKENEEVLFWAILSIVFILVIIVSICVCYRQRRQYIEEDDEDDDDSINSYSRFN